MSKTRTETDSFGPLEVPSEKYWGAQTQRSLRNFPIGWEKQPIAIEGDMPAIPLIRRARRNGERTDRTDKHRPWP